MTKMHLVTTMTAEEDEADTIEAALSKFLDLDTSDYHLMGELLIINGYCCTAPGQTIKQYTTELHAAIRESIGHGRWMTIRAAVLARVE